MLGKKKKFSREATAKYEGIVPEEHCVRQKNKNFSVKLCKTVYNSAKQCIYEEIVPEEHCVRQKNKNFSVKQCKTV